MTGKYFLVILEWVQSETCILGVTKPAPNVLTFAFWASHRAKLPKQQQLTVFLPVQWMENVQIRHPICPFPSKQLCVPQLPAPESQFMSFMNDLWHLNCPRDISIKTSQNVYSKLFYCLAKLFEIYCRS